MLRSITSFLPARQAAAIERLAATGALRELISFLLIGGTGALLFTVLNVFFTKSGIRPSISLTISYAILIPPMYYLQHRITFRSGRNHLSAFPRYVGAQAFGNLVSIGIAEVIPEPIKAYPITAYVLIAAIVAALNYTILKFWAFRHRPASVG